ncbi:MAG: asparaginase [Candidatus Longimicrobiales bacterium M2_2A_002]
MSGARVEVTRGGLVESVHAVDVAVVRDGGDRLVARAGSPDRAVFARSAVKPFQALPLVEDGVLPRYGLGPEALALACASHNGEPRHVAVARSMLDAVGLPESALACGPHPPFDDAAANALRAKGEEPGRIHNNCSGKHAGMLALASAHGWPTDGYQEAGHPVQERVLDEIVRWSGVDRSAIATGVDGCGVVTFALPLRALARAFAALAAAAAAEAGEAGPVAVVEAMTRHPFLVGGTDRLCTRLMEVTDGRVLAKVGAEGVYGAVVLDDGTGIALKARDGAKRAGEVALPGVLDALGALRPGELDALGRWASPEVRNTRDEVVGGMRAVVALEAGRG